MRVLHYIASTVWGGAEKSFTELCNELSKKMTVIVVLPTTNQIEDKLSKDIQLYKVANGSRYNPMIYMQLFHILQKTNPDIVHTHSAKASEIAYYLNKCIRFRHIATKRNSRKGKIFNKIKNVTAISKVTQKSIYQQNVKLIYNGIIKQPIDNIKQTNNKTLRLLAIGGLDKIKGFDILIKEVSKLDFPFVLDIVGDGEEKTNLQSLIKELNLSSKVNLLGFRDDIPSLIANSDIVITSSHSEGFGRVLVEALFYGDLMISTKVGLSIEILPDELLVTHDTIADKLIDIYNNQTHYKQIFKSIKEQYSSQFELQNNIDRYIEFYNAILAKDMDNQ
jgi:glycosyltransferase involved in cell wall biosynthesis